MHDYSKGARGLSV